LEEERNKQSKFRSKNNFFKEYKNSPFAGKTNKTMVFSLENNMLRVSLKSVTEEQEVDKEREDNKRC